MRARLVWCHVEPSAIGDCITCGMPASCAHGLRNPCCQASPRKTAFGTPRTPTRRTARGRHTVHCQGAGHFGSSCCRFKSKEEKISALGRFMVPLQDSGRGGGGAIAGASVPSRARPASACKRWYLCHKVSRLSTCCGLTGMHATGQTCTHWGSSKWPTHSVHLSGLIS